MQAPPQTLAEFSKFLPYAFALGVERTWADRFAATLGSAAVAEAVSDFYRDTSGGSFSPSRFASSLSGMSSAISAASTPPGSRSGSSGGGSSGGGGGGGGGGGW
jgi:uncharacterized membrane protein